MKYWDTSHHLQSWHWPVGASAAPSGPCLGVVSCISKYKSFSHATHKILTAAHLEMINFIQKSRWYFYSNEIRCTNILICGQLKDGYKKWQVVSEAFYQIVATMSADWLHTQIFTLPCLEYWNVQDTRHYISVIRFSLCHDSIKCSWQGFMTLTAGVTWHVSFTIYTGELDIVVTRNSKVDRTFQIYFSTGYWICMLQAINPEMVCTADIYHFCFKDFAKL